MAKRKKIVKAVGSLLLCMALTASGVISCAGPKEPSDPGTENSEKSVHVWTTYSNYAVMQEPESMEGAEKVPPTELSSDENLCISVFMGKGETEGAQIILTPEKDVESYDLEVSDIRCGDAVLGKDSIDLYNQGYIHAVHPDSEKYRWVPMGWYPDILVPFDKAKEYGENKVLAGKNQGITINFTTTSETKPGNYTGSFLLIIDGEKTEVPVSVTVRDIDLTVTHGMGGDASAMGDISVETYEMLMNDYRICCQYAPQAASSPTAMVEAVEKYWDNPHFTNYNIPNTDALTFKAFVKELAKASVDLEHNYLTKAVCYLQDLDESQNYSGIIATVGQFNQMKKEVKDELADTFAADTQLREAVFGAIDDLVIYVTTNTTEKKYTADNYQCQENRYSLNTDFRDLGTKASYREYYEESYSALWTYANFGFPKMNASLNQYRYCMRYLGWKIAQRDLAGHLFWDMNMPSKINAGERSLHMYQARDYYRDGLSFYQKEDMDYTAYGDGAQIYPAKKYGEPDAYYGSLRIAAFRDGVEDNEALYQLEQVYKTLADEYVAGEKNFDQMLEWVYNKGLSNELACYMDDEETLYEMRKIVFDLYDLARDKAVKLLCTGIDFDGGSATIEFYTRAGSVVLNGETLTGENGKYMYTWKLNDSPKIELKLGENQFEADVFDFGELKDAAADRQLSESNVGQYFSGQSGSGKMAQIGYAGDRNAVTISLEETPADALIKETPFFRVDSGLFGTDDLLDMYYITMKMRMRFRSEEPVEGRIPMRVNLYQDDSATDTLNIFEWDTTEKDEEGWMEQEITLKVDRVFLKNIESLDFIFQDYHLEYYYMGAEIEISDIYYTDYPALGK